MGSERDFHPASKLQLDRVRWKRNRKEKHGSNSEGKPPRANGNFLIDRRWVSEPNEEESQSQEEDPLRLARYNTEHCKGEEYEAIDKDALPSKESIDNMPTIKLAHWQEIEGCHKQSCPPSKANWM